MAVNRNTFEHGNEIEMTTSGSQDVESLRTMLRSLYKSGQYSDLVIKCQRKKWNVHRAIVCTQSKPLAACMGGGFIEAAIGEIDFDEDSPEIVDLLIQFLYHGDYTPRHPSSSHTQSSSNEQIPTLSLIPKNVSQLRNLSGDFDAYGAMKPLTTSETTHGEDIAASFLPIHATLYTLAERLDIQTLKSLCLSRYTDDLLHMKCTNNKENKDESTDLGPFITSLGLIYDGTPSTTIIDPIRASAITAAATHADQLIQEPNFILLCQSNAELATDLLKATLSTARQKREEEEKGNRGWKMDGIIPGRGCKKDRNHQLAFVPVGFGNTGYMSGNGGRNGSNSGVIAASGFGSLTVAARYKCMTCKTFVD